jgi:hypothetical protein
MLFAFLPINVHTNGEYNFHKTSYLVLGPKINMLKTSEAFYSNFPVLPHSNKGCYYAT